MVGELHSWLSFGSHAVPSGVAMNISSYPLIALLRLDARGARRLLRLAGLALLCLLVTACGRERREKVYYIDEDTGMEADAGRLDDDTSSPGDDSADAISDSPDPGTDVETDGVRLTVHLAYLSSRWAERRASSDESFLVLDVELTNVAAAAHCPWAGSTTGLSRPTPSFCRRQATP